MITTILSKINVIKVCNNALWDIFHKTLILSVFINEIISLMSQKWSPPTTNECCTAKQLVRYLERNVRRAGGSSVVAPSLVAALRAQRLTAFFTWRVDADQSQPRSSSVVVAPLLSPWQRRVYTTTSMTMLSTSELPSGRRFTDLHISVRRL